MPWWSKPKEEPGPDKGQDSSNSSNSPAQGAFDPDRLPPRERLPKKLQQIVDTADADSRFFDDLREG